MTQKLKVFPAKKIITMNPSQPEASAVAVKDDIIASVGTMETLQPWLDEHDYEVFDLFENKIIMPGFIDPHLHPWLATKLFSFKWCTPYDWEFPNQTIEGVKGRDSYIRQLQKFHNDIGDPEKPLITFGYHQLFHGDVQREDLDNISDTRPIILWQRSYHEIRCNTPGLELIDAKEGAEWDPNIDLDKGRLYETGLTWALKRLKRFWLKEPIINKNIQKLKWMVHQGGITTIADNAFTPSPSGSENNEIWDLYKKCLDNEETPFRTFVIPRAAASFGISDDDGNLPDRVMKLSKELRNSERTSGRLSALKTVKTFADGGFITQLMQLGPPGYIDGHQGTWIVSPEELKAEVEEYWKKGFDVDVHVNGDMGIDATLDTLQELLHDVPRFDHRFTLHHYGYSTQSQATRTGELDATVSANGYYLYYWGDKYAEYGLGHDRSSQMIRLGSLARNNVKISLHSDVPMAPPKPLLAVWAVTSRETFNGQVMAPNEALSIDQALRGITIDAAYQLRLDDKIGSIEAGKKADFTILDENPYEVGIDEIKNINIWGTVFEGEVYPTDDQ